MSLRCPHFRGGLLFWALWIAAGCGPVDMGNTNANGNGGGGTNDNANTATGNTVEDLPNLSDDDGFGAGEGADVPVSGLVLVGFDQSISEGLLGQLAASTANALNGTLVDIIPDIQVITVAVENGTEADAVVLAEQLVSVDYAELDVAGRVAAVDEFLPGARSAAFAQYQLFVTNAINARGVAASGTGDVSVAVLDTGCMLAHAEFAGSRVSAGANYIDGDGDITDDFPGGHGTGVVSLLAAGINSGEIAGLLPGFDVTVHRVCDGAGFCPLDAVVLGIIGALNGNADLDITTSETSLADVINLSLSFADDYKTLARAVFEAEARGVAVVAAAGNNGRGSSAESPRYPAGYSTVLAVGATDIQDRAAPFSNRAAILDAVAPGVDLLVADAIGSYVYVNGTSYAAAQISAAVAFLLQREAPLTITEIRTRLQSRGDALPANAGFGALNVRRLNLLAVIQDQAAPTEPYLIPDATLVQATGTTSETLVARQVGRSDAGVTAEAFGGELVYWYGYFPATGVTFEMIDRGQRLPLLPQSVVPSTIDLFVEFLRGLELGTLQSYFGVLQQAAFEMPELGGARRAVSVVASSGDVMSAERSLIYNPLQPGYNIISYKNFDSAVLHLLDEEGDNFNPAEADLQLLGFGARPEINWIGGFAANQVQMGSNLDPDYSVSSEEEANDLLPPVRLGECVGAEVPEQLCGTNIELPANELTRLVVRVFEGGGFRYAILDVIFVP